MITEANVTPAFLLHYQELERLPMTWFMSDYPQLKRAAKVLFRYGWDNDHLYVEYYAGHLFQIYYNADKVQNKVGEWNFSLSTWGAGGVGLAHIAFKGGMHDTFGDKLKPIYKSWDTFLSGKLVCADCGREFPKSDPHGSIFAAVYCQECWTGETGSRKGTGGWYAYQNRSGFYD